MIILKIFSDSQLKTTIVPRRTLQADDCLKAFPSCHLLCSSIFIWRHKLKIVDSDANDAVKQVRFPTCHKFCSHSLFFSTASVFLNAIFERRTVFFRSLSFHFPVRFRITHYYTAFILKRSRGHPFVKESSRFLKQIYQSEKYVSLVSLRKETIFDSGLLNTVLILESQSLFIVADNWFKCDTSIIINTGKHFQRFYAIGLELCK